MKTAIYIGLIASCAAFPIGLLRLLEHDPWPWCGVFLALALGTIGVSVWSLRQTRTAEQILGYLVQHGESYALSMVEAGIGARGTIYVLLHQMEEDGLISSRCEPATSRLPRRLYSITDLGRQRQGVPSARHEAGAGPHPVRRAALLAPLVLLPRAAAAAQPDPFREAALTNRRAWRRQIAVTMAIARLAPGLRARWPWHDVPQFANNIEWALSCDSSPEELVAFAATSEEWRRILGRLRPGADVLGAVRRAMARPVADEEVERGETAALASYRAAWMEHAAKRRAALPGVLAVLRGAAVALLLVLVGCLGPEPAAPDDLAPEVVSTDGGVVRLYKPDLAVACTPATRLDTLDNCGACGHSCRGDEWPGFPAACCPWIEQPHIGRCAILNTDNDCSGCGDQCTGGRHCVSGRCVP